MILILTTIVAEPNNRTQMKFSICLIHTGSTKNTLCQVISSSNVKNQNIKKEANNCVECMVKMVDLQWHYSYTHPITIVLA